MSSTVETNNWRTDEVWREGEWFITAEFDKASSETTYVIYGPLEIGFDEDGNPNDWQVEDWNDYSDFQSALNAAEKAIAECRKPAAKKPPAAT